MNITFSKKFDKSFAKLKKKQQAKVMEVISLFSDTPTDFRLKNHKLKGDKRGFRAISAGGDVRIIFEEKGNYIEVLMLDVGSHNQVY